MCVAHKGPLFTLFWLWERQGENEGETGLLNWSLEMRDKGSWPVLIYHRQAMLWAKVPTESGLKQHLDGDCAKAGPVQLESVSEEGG